MNTISTSSVGRALVDMPVERADVPLAVDRTTGAALVLPLQSAPAVSAGVSKFRTQVLGVGAQLVKAAPGNVLGLTVINPNSDKVFVKFCNIAATGVTVGTSPVVHVLEVPANDGDNDGQLLVPPGAFPLFNFSTAISVYA